MQWRLSVEHTHTNRCEFEGMVAIDRRFKPFPILDNKVSQSKYYIYSIVDDYFPKERGDCSNPDNLHGKYVSLKRAKIACNRDNHCIGVHENPSSRQSIAFFQVCKTGFRTPSQLSWIHEKQGFAGTSQSTFLLQ